MFDSHSRMLASIDGERDPNAVFPVADGTAVPEDGDYDDEPVPPTAERVVRRMYALLALAARGLLDMNLKMGNKPAYRLDKLHQWLEALDIAEEFEPDE